MLPLLLLLGSATARADVMLDLGLFYYSDTFSYSSTSSTYNRLLWDFGASLELGKKSKWSLGWAYDSMSFGENPGTATKLTVTDMGPKLTYFIDKNRTWVLAFTYDLITKGSYSNGTAAAVELRGSAMKFDAGYMPEIAENFLMGAKLTYYRVSFNESVVSTTLTKTTNSRTVIYPNFALVYRFE